MKHPTLFSIHKWLGISLFLLFFLQGLTGVLMANKSTLISLNFAKSALPYTGSAPLTLDETIAHTQALYPSYTLDRIIYPKDSDGPRIARLKSKEAFWLQIVSLDNETGAPLAYGPLWHYPSQLAERVHVSLLSGRTGNLILMGEGLILTFMAISGLIVWWPAKGRFIRGFRITNTLGTKRLIRDLHVVPAAIFAPFLILSALTGALIIAEPLLKPIVSIFAPTGPDLQLNLAKVDRPVQLTSWQDSLEQLQSLFKDDHISQLRFVAGDRLLGSVIHTDTFLNPRAHHIAGIDRYSGQSLILEEAGTGLAGDRFMEWFLPLHTGEIYGPIRTLLLTTLGLLLSALSVTGIIMWQQRRSARR
ncbi:MAG: PepSY domain-containing protein [Kordiimonadaceae bacterium]|nr:PepSY domain-containing protein [Kordiimonadaceae bacterium]